MQCCRYTLREKNNYIISNLSLFGVGEGCLEVGAFG